MRAISPGWSLVNFLDETSFLWPGEGHGDASSAPAVRPSEMRQPHSGSKEAEEQLADHLCPLRVSA